MDKIELEKALERYEESREREIEAHDIISRLSEDNPEIQEFKETQRVLEERLRNVYKLKDWEVEYLRENGADIYMSYEREKADAKK